MANTIGMSTGVSASADLGLGTALGQQVRDETEEEKRRRRLGLSALQSPSAALMLGYGSAGVGKV